MPVILGGPGAQKVMTKGDLVIAFQHVNGEESMILWPRDKRTGSGAFVIPLESAYKYGPDRLAGETRAEQGTRMAEAISQCLAGAKVMCMPLDRATVHRIYTVIGDHLEDLIRMKPDKGPEANGERMVRRGEITPEQLLVTTMALRRRT